MVVVVVFKIVVVVEDVEDWVVVEGLPSLLPERYVVVVDDVKVDVVVNGSPPLPLGLLVVVVDVWIVISDVFSLKVVDVVVEEVVGGGFV